MLQNGICCSSESPRDAALHPKWHQHHKQKWLCLVAQTLMFYALWDTLRPLPGHMDDTGSPAPPLEGGDFRESSETPQFLNQNQTVQAQTRCLGTAQTKETLESHTQVHFPSPASPIAAHPGFPPPLPCALPERRKRFLL